MENSVVDRILGPGPCSFSSCDRLALPLTDPPACAAHVADLDSWYTSCLQTTAGLKDSRSRQLAGFLQDRYRYAITELPIAHDIYLSYEKRRAGGRSIAFAFHDVVFFVIAAAAAGIIEGSAYDALKALIRRAVPKQKKRQTLSRHLRRSLRKSSTRNKSVSTAPASVALRRKSNAYCAAATASSFSASGIESNRRSALPISSGP